MLSIFFIKKKLKRLGLKSRKGKGSTMKKKYAALLVAAAIMAVPGTLAMAAGSPNTNTTVRGGGSSHASQYRTPGLNVNAGTITNKTTTGVKNDGQNGTNGVSVGADGINVRFASDQEIRDLNTSDMADKVFSINAGVQIFRVTGDSSMVGYEPLIPAEQLITTAADGSRITSMTTVNVSVAALGNVQDVKVYYYDSTQHGWVLAQVNAVDAATNTVNVTMPGNAIFTLVHYAL